MATRFTDIQGKVVSNVEERRYRTESEIMSYFRCYFYDSNSNKMCTLRMTEEHVGKIRINRTFKIFKCVQISESDFRIQSTSKVCVVIYLV